VPQLHGAVTHGEQAGSLGFGPRVVVGPHRSGGGTHRRNAAGVVAGGHQQHRPRALGQAAAAVEKRPLHALGER
jgi:hypothetical protein